ncbi:MAG TPA: hypothetical protein VIL20_15620 [Sandaracinaceae bacterium]
MAYPEFLIDRRVVQRNIAKGLVDAKEYEKYLAELPDVQGNAEVTVIEPAVDEGGEAGEGGEG